MFAARQGFFPPSSITPVPGAGYISIINGTNGTLPTGSLDAYGNIYMTAYVSTGSVGTYIFQIIDGVINWQQKTSNSNIPFYDLDANNSSFYMVGQDTSLNRPSISSVVDATGSIVSEKQLSGSLNVTSINYSMDQDTSVGYLYVGGRGTSLASLCIYTTSGTGGNTIGSLLAQKSFSGSGVASSTNYFVKVVGVYIIFTGQTFNGSVYNTFIAVTNNTISSITFCKVIGNSPGILSSLTSMGSPTNYLYFVGPGVSGAGASIIKMDGNINSILVQKQIPGINLNYIDNDGTYLYVVGTNSTNTGIYVAKLTNGLAVVWQTLITKSSSSITDARKIIVNGTFLYIFANLGSVNGIIKMNKNTQTVGTFAGDAGTYTFTNATNSYNTSSFTANNFTPTWGNTAFSLVNQTNTWNPGGLSIANTLL